MTKDSKKLAKSILCSFCVATIALVVACGGGEGESQGTKLRFVNIGTAPVGGVFYTIGGAISDVLNQSAEEQNWKVTAQSTGGSMENIRRLDSEEIQFAVSNSSITYFAARGEEGWEKAYSVSAVMTLFPNVAMFVTKKDSGIATPADLKGKRVAVGPEGAGFEYFIRPILAAHGVTYDDFEDVYAGQQSCVDLLGDGAIDAAFLGGGVPTGSITSAAATMEILLVPYGESEKKQLVDEYPFFGTAKIPAETYRGQDKDYLGLNVGSAHLITRTDADEELVYAFTKTIYEGRAAVAEKHKAGRAINEKNAIRNTGIDFHPGAIRFYREAGIWPEKAAASEESAP